jgi:membrane protein YdbS with pleckstrin-like domain
MSIPRDFLADDEEVLVDLRPHWVFVFGPLFVTVVALGVAIGVAAAFPNAPTALTWALAVMVLIPAGWLAGRVTRWSGTRLIVTTKRMVLRRGILGRDLRQLRLQRITEVHSVQSVLERLIGAGRLVVELQGESQAVAVDDVRRPKSLQRVLTNRLDELSREGRDPARAPGGGGVAGPPVVSRQVLWTGEPTPAQGVSLRDPQERADRKGPAESKRTGSASVPDQLIQLDDLRRRGIVTPAEFEAKKAELLDRL